MIYDQQTIAALEALQSVPWTGTVFRHMFGSFLPERENVSGARWNPPETPAIYTSLDRNTAIAEADFYINLQPLRPRARRNIYRIEVTLTSVLNLSDWNMLRSLGVERQTFDSSDYAGCQMVGGTAEWLGYDGILVPSARARGSNLIIFPNRRKPGYTFAVVDSEELAD